MFFLLADGINYIVKQKHYGEFEYKGFIWGVSKLLANATINELKSQGVNESFIQDRIFNYASLLTEIDDDNRMMYITIILNEKPLNNLIKTSADFSNVTSDSNLSRNLGEILILNSSVSQAIGLMKQAMNKSYGLK